MRKSRTTVSGAKAMDTEIRETCKILEAIANGYPRGSAERAAIRLAADAFIHVRLHEGLKKSYRAFQRSCGMPLNKDQQAILKRAGVTL
jgi:hypothetical protein